MTDEKNGSSLERLLRAYIKMRDTRTDAKRQFDQADKAMVEKMGLIEAQLLKMLNAAGSDSLKVSGVGQAFLAKQVVVRATDWNALWEHILKSKNIDLLQKRVSSTAVQEYVKTEGELPPGVDMITERVVNVRRD